MPEPIRKALSMLSPIYMQEVEQHGQVRRPLGARAPSHNRQKPGTFPAPCLVPTPAPFTRPKRGHLPHIHPPVPPPLPHLAPAPAPLQAATRRVLDLLMPLLEPFATRHRVSVMLRSSQKVGGTRLLSCTVRAAAARRQAGWVRLCL